MANQELRTVITLSGRVDNSVGELGVALTDLGSQLDHMTGKVQDFLKEGSEKYIAYDDVMREVQALGEYENSTMKVLDEYNRSIAKNSKYTMEQAARTEVLMAQLGLDLEATKTLMPATMNLATASNIELAESLDYLYYSLNALDKPISYAGTLSDQMAKTSAISASDIDTLGESLQRLGSGAQFFTGGSSELLAILGGISQFGEDMQGSDAGTQLRNFMLTLVAPTAGKQKLLETLQVTETEWAEFESYLVGAGIDMTNTAAAMDELGFSVYDSAGTLKPAIQIISELDAALSGLSEAERNETLGNLFGKRTTTTALNLMDALGTIIDYQHQIEEHSAGYTEAMAETMEGGLGGARRELEASLDALGTRAGQTLAPFLEDSADILSGIVNDLNSMDDDKWDALVSGVSVVAAAGPALLAAGGALRLISFAATPLGAATLGLFALGAAATALHKLSESNFEANFGNMDLDTDTLLAHVNGISDAFNSAYVEVDAFDKALSAAVETYTDASSELSGDLLTNMITGATLTEDDKSSLLSLGDAMGTALLDGINASFDKSASYLTMLFGGTGEAETDTDYQEMILLYSSMHEEVSAQGAALGEDFSKALNDAIADGFITGDEYSLIMEKMQAYNNAMAFIQQAEREGELAMQLHKAQSVSWDSASGFLAEQQTLMNDSIEQAELEHAYESAKLIAYYNRAIEEGWIKPGTTEAYTEDDRDAALESISNQYHALITSYENQNAQVALGVVDALIGQSNMGDAWNYLIGRGEQDLSAYTTEELQVLLQSLVALNGDRRISKLLSPYADTNTIGPILDSLLSGSYIQELINQEIDARNRASGMTVGGTDAYGRTAAERIGEMSYDELVNQMMLLDAEIQSRGWQNAGDYISQWEEVNARMDELEGAATPYYALPAEQLPAWYNEYLAHGSEEGKAYAEAFQTALDENPAYIPVYPYEPRSLVGAPSTKEPFSSVPHISLFAEGGRATTASIFGEAGPEWAIPEEHSQRTADLLDAARQASGFTWPELLARNGGLNGGGVQTRQLIYSPTIIAQDARGVEEKLLEDKARLDRWWAETKLREDLEVYS